MCQISMIKCLSAVPLHGTHHAQEISNSFQPEAIVIAQDNAQEITVSISEVAGGEDCVLLNCGSQHGLTLTAQQARLLCNQLIQAVQRVEVKTSLLQPKQALRRGKQSQVSSKLDGALMAK